jgi:hypothetical protein
VQIVHSVNRLGGGFKVMISEKGMVADVERNSCEVSEVLKMPHKMHVCQASLHPERYLKRRILHRCENLTPLANLLTRCLSN